MDLRVVCFLPILLLACGDPLTGSLGEAPPHIAAMVEELRSRPIGPWGTEERTYPLPVAASWANGSERLDSQRYSTQWQIDRLLEGYRFLPTVPMLPPHLKNWGDDGLKETARDMARLGVPLAWRSNQPFLDVLGSPYKYMGEDSNPRAFLRDETGDPVFSTLLSPWASSEAWVEVGFNYATSVTSRQLYDLYPDPPLVIFLDNNEAWKTVQAYKVYEQEARFAEKYHPDANLNAIKAAVSYGMACKFRQYLDGLKSGMPESWREVVITVPYKGSMDGETQFDYRTRGEDANAQRDIRGPYNPWDGTFYWSYRAWDGSSPPYYLHDWQRVYDFNVRSPRFFVMTMAAVGHREAFEWNPDHFVELSVWDGGAKKRNKIEELFPGQEWSSQRYLGYVRWGMWIARPQVVREFRASQNWVEVYLEDTMALIRAVEEVWDNPVLEKFWRNSVLVPNPDRQHPLWRGPTGFEDVPRMFLLEVSTHPEVWRYEDANIPEGEETVIPVWALARKLGDEYLVFADAPLGDREGVTVTIPGHGDVVLDVPLGGAFWLVAGSTVEKVQGP